MKAWITSLLQDVNGNVSSRRILTILSAIGFVALEAWAWKDGSHTREETEALMVAVLPVVAGLVSIGMDKKKA
jgi:hypothetical protein